MFGNKNITEWQPSELEELKFNSTLSYLFDFDYFAIKGQLNSQHSLSGLKLVKLVQLI